MKKIRYLHIEFDEEIAGHEIPAFRGGIIEKAGRENVLFHNHLSGNKFLYSYPLIQYKTIKKRPTIICVDNAVDEIHKFFENKDWSLEISGRQLNMEIRNLRVNKFVLQVWDKKFSYQIRNWLALNQKNLEKFEEIENWTDKKLFLERILRGNILSMAKGVGWNVDKKIEIDLLEIEETRVVRFKGVRLKAFNVQFESNVFLPNFLGLGKGVSFGFGVVRKANVQVENKSI